MHRPQRAARPLLPANGTTRVGRGSAPAIADGSSPAAVAAGPVRGRSPEWLSLDTPDGGKHYYASGADGRLARSDDGGRTWSVITPPPNKENYLSPLFVLDAQHVSLHSCVSEAVSSNGGRTWRTVHGTTRPLPAQPVTVPRSPRK